MSGGLCVKATGRTVALPDGREAQEASAFITGQGPGCVVLRTGTVAECGEKEIGCLVDSGGTLWAVRALPVAIARKYLEPGRPS